jgi:hypothetical protein
MNLVGQAAGYLGGRVPAQKSKDGGGGFMSHLNPMQFTKGLPKVPGMPGEGMGLPGMSGGGAAGGAAAGGEAAGGAAAAEELLPLLLL